MSERKPVLGILGGGQLARMMVLEGAPLGVTFRIVDPADTPCAAQLAPTRRADWNDLDALAPFAEAIDVATFDFENVPAETAQWLTEHVQVHPGPRALAVAQDRMAEKTLFRDIGLDTARFAAVDTRADLDRALHEIGAPAILKTRRLGYDGKGQFRLRDAVDADAAWAALGEQAAQHGLILEAFVPFDYEVSVIAVRGRDGEFRTWPLTRNWHADGILSLSLAPAPGADAIADSAFAHARTLAERLDYVGVFALELFVKDGRVLGNEMAPRVHNSGHWTYDGAVTSQFQNHVRAVLGLPLGDTSARGCSVMFNWIGAMPPVAPALAVGDVHWHDYGKSSRPGRKVGHATVCAADFATLRTRVEALAQALDRVEQASPLLDLPVS
ncbi:5-(carboxyamino)imidazole ribonucleotide synthase [Oleiagrimonas soli]|uniref:N5-carboxyaminoimidazole ribonucleotide synthase n=1 Tax=Oleiagrimonas soli TaxID=1543381 RepID=A0A099CY15_9GAMM|nr:5-(carboxyamino)imidazole ribonucleotide synthase [Oleiagrimonas soli]KGI78659.1 phosphoribosylaminoimidazole carboxylase [Oleiagrimonas soli]MBB6184032.1 5-(carboxyamino)imidazole ribonucleotide synthase [Oleiagrimonas soli]